MELLAVSLVILFAFQLFQTPRRRQDKEVREAPELITAPTEAPATLNRLKLLLDGDEPETGVLSSVNDCSVAVEAVAPVTEAAFAATKDASTAAAIATVTSADDAADLSEGVAVSAERVLAEDLAILQGRGFTNASTVVPAVVVESAESSEVVEVVPFEEERRAASASRKDAVFALLDEAAAQGISGYIALTGYVKQQSGQGTSRSTIKAWKEAREVEQVVAHG